MQEIQRGGEADVAQWLATTRHPQFDKPYNELVYQPMLELLGYLRDNDFKTFIVSGGGIDFMRVWVGEVYGIPRDQVIGSSIKTEFVIGDNGPEINQQSANVVCRSENHTWCRSDPLYCGGWIVRVVHPV